MASGDLFAIHQPGFHASPRYPTGLTGDVRSEIAEEDLEKGCFSTIDHVTES